MNWQRFFFLLGKLVKHDFFPENRESRRTPRASKKLGRRAGPHFWSREEGSERSANRNPIHSLSGRLLFRRLAAANQRAQTLAPTLTEVFCSTPKFGGDLSPRGKRSVLTLAKCGLLRLGMGTYKTGCRKG